MTAFGSVLYTNRRDHDDPPHTLNPQDRPLSGSVIGKLTSISSPTC